MRGIATGTRRGPIVLASVLVLACKQGPSESGSKRPDHDRRHWPASVEQSTFERVGPLPLTHPLAGSRMEQVCVSEVEQIIADTTSDRVARLEELFPTCGDGFGIAWRIGQLRLDAGDRDGGIDWLVRELGGTYPVFIPALLATQPLFDSFSAEERAKFAGLGETVDAPMWLPSTDLQMSYIAAFVCSGDARYTMQALVEHEGQSMDRISFECIGGGEGHRYFALPLMTARMNQ